MLKLTFFWRTGPEHLWRFWDDSMQSGRCLLYCEGTYCLNFLVQRWTLNVPQNVINFYHINVESLLRIFTVIFVRTTHVACFLWWTLNVPQNVTNFYHINVASLLRIFSHLCESHTCRLLSVVWNKFNFTQLFQWWLVFLELGRILLACCSILVFFKLLKSSFPA